MRRNKRGYRSSKVIETARFDKKFVKFLSISILSLVALLLVVIVFYHANEFFLHKQFLDDVDKTLAFASLDSALSENNDDEQTQKEETDTSFTLTAIGDIMCSQALSSDAYKKDTDNYDFSYVFENINRYIKTSDITVGTLETTFSSKDSGYNNSSKRNSPDDLAYNLKKLGVNVLSTASDHCLDMDFNGLSRTIDVLNDSDIFHVGNYQTEEDRNKVLFRYVKGIKIAFISYTYGVNAGNVPSDKGFCVNLIDQDLIKKDIETAKFQEADLIVACMHWGTDYQSTVNSTQKDTTDFLFANGVDVILGTNPHMLQPMEKRTITLEDGSTKDGFVIYSLGDFMTDKNTNNSIILNLKITKHLDGTITIDQADYVPLYMEQDNSKDLRKYKLLDLEKLVYNYESGADSSISQKNYNFYKLQLEKIGKMLGSEF